jgi:hypothetical protein
MTKDEAIKAVVSLAEAEVGYHEKSSNAQLDDPDGNSGGNNWTKYARDLDALPNFYNGKKNGYAWCDILVDWLFVKTFGEERGRQMLYQPEQSAGAGCLYSAGYYKQNNAFHRSNPRLGDQIFFSYSPGEYSHTGIVVDVNGNTITTVEGNTSDSVGRRTYETSNRSIAGYGTPNWDLALEIWEKPWAVVVNGKIVNSGDPQKTEEAKAEQPKEDHSWSPPLLKYDPDNYFEAVKLLQCHLNVRNFNSGKADGYFGPITQAAVNRAKTYYGLEADGICDKPLWDKLGVT